MTISDSASMNVRVSIAPVQRRRRKMSVLNVFLHRYHGCRLLTRVTDLHQRVVCHSRDAGRVSHESESEQGLCVCCACAVCGSACQESNLA